MFLVLCTALSVSCLGGGELDLAATEHSLATLESIEPQQMTVQPGDTVTYQIQVTTDLASMTDVSLRFSMDDLNDLGTPGDNGLAEDAEEDYGNGGGLQTFRPVEFVSADPGGPNNTDPSTPAAGALSGDIVWNFGSLGPSLTFNLSVTVRVPTGTINGKTIRGRATLTSDGVSTTVTASNLTTVSNAVSDYVRMRDPVTPSTEPPDEINLLARFSLQNNQSTDIGTEDIEDVTLTIGGSTGTCVPVFRSAVINNLSLPPQYTNAYQIVSVPANGALLDAGNPVVVHFDRLPLNVGLGMVRVDLRYDLPASCVENDQVILRPEVTTPTLTLDDDSADVVVNVGAELCRNASMRVLRLQSGNLVMNDYEPWPEHPVLPLSADDSIIEGSVRPGEYIMMQTPNGLGLGQQTVVLDATYYMFTIPDGITWHGIRSFDWLGDNGATSYHGAYKDCDGDALLPTEMGFDHTNPSMSGWNNVEKSWPGTPFSGAQSDADPSSVAGPECRLLFVKLTDSPSDTSPDFGNWIVTSIFRGCDGSFGCTEETGLINMDNNEHLFSLYNDGMDTTVTDCGNPGLLRQFYIGVESFPLVHAEPQLAANVLAGQFATVDINPGNFNFASEYAQSRWYVDFSRVIGRVNLDGVLSEVVTTGAQFPAANQNIMGQSCDPSAIAFNGPNQATCVSAGDPGCLAWWDVPDACQPPNGYFGPDNMSFLDDHLQYPIFRLQVPVLNNVSANSLLEFVGEARQSDGLTLGADNVAAPARWNVGSNARSVASYVVQPTGTAEVDKIAPGSWTDGAVMYYTLDAQNLGNVPLKGIYMVDRLPKMGDTLKSEFTPIYRQVYTDLPAGDVVVEYNTVPGSNCYDNPLGVAWTSVGMMEASAALSGYISRTTVDIPATADCVRVHLTNDAAVEALDPNIADPGLDEDGRFFIAIGVEIPGNQPLGDLVFNQAKIGASTTLNSGEVNLALTESNVVQTEVSNEPVVSMNKTFEIDETRPGMIKWTLRYFNASGAIAMGATVTDTLPTDVFYDSLGAPLSANESCKDGDDGIGGCRLIMTDGDGSGGQIRFTIGTLTPYDGAVGVGTDEGVIEIWTRNKDGLVPGTTIQNCAGAILPTTPMPQPAACVTTTTIDLALTKEITGNPTNVQIGDTMEYVIVANNNTMNTQYVTVYDQVPSDVSFVSGSMTINGLLAPDTFFVGDELTYPHPVPLSPMDMLEVRFEVRVDGPAMGGTLVNTAIGSGCTSPLVPITCAPANASTAVNVTVDPLATCGDMMLGANEGCDDGNTMGGDNCSAACLIENTNPCNSDPMGATGDASCDSGVCDVVGNPTPGICEPAMTCGNGVVEMGEQCDDGDTMDGPACRGDCTIPGCGDGVLDAGEGCDDGNLMGSDGCSPACLVEDGSACNDVAPGLTDDMSCESGNCDDIGNMAPGVCEPVDTCGNGLLESGEVCDDGNVMDGDGCSAACDSDETCGNGVLDTSVGEACDDGNMADGDGCQSNCQLPVCGDGVTDPGEVCDDGNTMDGDGCSAACDSDETCGNGIVDTSVGEACDDGNMTSGDGCQPTCQLPVCGDGFVDPGEVCDDGNTMDADGCSAACDSDETCGNNILDPGEGCDDGNTIDGDGCQGNCQLANCGDGVVDMGEVCDDGNNMDGDGCAANCLSDETCGNGVADTTIGEVCDDGNMMDGDGCSANCMSNETCGNSIIDVAAGEVCDDGNTMDGDMCSANCQSDETCGNGIVDVAAGEVCDDGNMADGDGCAANCQSDETCGNSIIDVAAGEVCDDGNTMDGDMCSANCQSDETCGNGVVDVVTGEVCDDGNNDDGDGCAANCLSDETCGNGILDGGEGCDDGNTAAGDGCGATCLIEDGIVCNDDAAGTVGADSCESGICDVLGNPAPGVCEPADTCGNGVVESAEQCDDGNLVDEDGCSAACEVEVTCGNGTLDIDEGCDDTNQDDGDGCNMDCLIETGNPCNADDAGMTGAGSCASGVCDDVGNEAPGVCEDANECGNGVLEAGEGCDDGNTDAGDGCSGSCLIENDGTCNVDDAGNTGNDSCASGYCDENGVCGTPPSPDIGVSGGGCAANGQSAASAASMWWLFGVVMLLGWTRRRRVSAE